MLWTNVFLTLTFCSRSNTNTILMYIADVFGTPTCDKHHAQGHL